MNEREKGNWANDQSLSLSCAMITNAARDYLPKTFAFVVQSGRKETPRDDMALLARVRRFGDF